MSAYFKFQISKNTQGTSTLQGVRGQGWLAWWVEFMLNVPLIGIHYFGYLLPI